ncbi:MAG: transglycosylase SLT domain-containing protein [Trueperaceae bacterium]
MSNYKIFARVFLIALTVLSVLAVTAALWIRQAGRLKIPIPEVQAVVFDPYSDPRLAGYKLYRDALMVNDWITLENLAMTRNDYVAYRAALSLTQQTGFPPLQLLSYYRRLLELRIDDPLDKVEKPQLLVAYAAVAEQAGSFEEAIRAYHEALPLPSAIEGLKRVQTDPYKLARLFVDKRRYQDALESLGERSAPALEATIHLNLDNYEIALGASERWLAEVPGDREALRIKAWSLFYLGRNEEADALFATVLETEPSHPDALYGRALIAKKADNIDAAVTYLRQSKDSENLWLATGYLESKERYADALPLYLELGKLSGSFADDGAYRAFVLANRLGDTASAEIAKTLLPQDSFFSLKLGLPLSLTTTAQLEPVRTPDMEIAELLANVGDVEAGIGELLFALRRSSSPAEKLSLAELLQQLGEYRHSWRAAEELRSQGIQDARLWKLSYPQAYSTEVIAEAARHNLEPALLWAIMRQESAFYPQAISRSNAKGLMQVIPSTWEWLAELQKETPGDPFDPATNIRYGAFYLQWLLNYLQSDEELVIVSYNRGQGYIKRLFESSYVAGNKDELYREIDALEAREYLQKVTLNYEIYKQLYPN